MDLMQDVWEGLQSESARAGAREIMENVADQRVKLDKEVARWCQERGLAAQ